MELSALLAWIAISVRIQFHARCHRRYPEGPQIVRGGRTHAEVIDRANTDGLRRPVLRTVERGSIVSTDESRAYTLLTRDGYIHGAVRHMNREYVRGVHHTNSIESFWRLFKNSIRSTHIHVSGKYMDRYLKEFTFRSNHRGMVNAMFDLLIASV